MQIAIVILMGLIVVALLLIAFFAMCIWRAVLGGTSTRISHKMSVDNNSKVIGNLVNRLDTVVSTLNNTRGVYKDLNKRLEMLDRTIYESGKLLGNAGQQSGAAKAVDRGNHRGTKP